MDYKEKVIALLNSQDLSKEQKEKLENIFPELKESEDEKISLEIRNFIWGYPDKLPERDKWLAWFEKQWKKESDPRYKCLEDLLTADDIHQMSMNEAMVEEAKSKAVNALTKLGISELLGLEKQGGQTHDELNQSEVTSDQELEPKFKVGDWIIRSAEGFKHNTYLVKEVKDYYVCEELNGRQVTFTFNDVYNNFKLWDISDAKDGDVLVSGEVIFIFNKIHGVWVNCYCSLHKDGSFCEENYDLMHIKYAETIYPSTNEQRDIFFAKMNEAGYEWDSEIKKIEVASKESEDEQLKQKRGKL